MRERLHQGECQGAADRPGFRTSELRTRGVDSDRFLSVAEIAQLLGVSIHTIYGMIHERRLPFRYHKFGRRVLIDRREFERWASEAGIAEDGRIRHR